MPVGCGPGCGWLNIDTVEEEVAVGFRQAFTITQKEKQTKKKPERKPFTPSSSMCSPSVAVRTSEMITEGEARLFRQL